MGLNLIEFVQIFLALLLCVFVNADLNVAGEVMRVKNTVDCCVFL